MNGNWQSVVRSFALALACGGWGPPEPAPAPGLRWRAPAGCPDTDAVEEQLDALMPGDDALDAVAIDGDLGLSEDGYVLGLTIAVDDEVEHRSVESNDCVLLARTAALLVAITVDAVGVAATIVERDVVEPGADDDQADDDVEVRQDVPDVEPLEPAQDSPTNPSGQATPARAARPQRDAGHSKWRHGIGAGVAGGVGVGLVPGATGGLEAHVGWRYGPVRLRAVGFHWFSQRESLMANAGVRAALSGGGIRGCYAVTRGRFDFPLCMGPDVAALHGAGFGSSVRERPTADVWVAWATGAALEVHLGRRFALLGRAEAVVTIRRPALHLDGDEGPIEVFRASITSFRLVLGAAVFSR